MTLGQMTLGDAPIQGRIRNLNVMQTGPDEIQCTYDHEGFEEGEHHALVYVNGTLAAVDATGTVTCTGLSEGYQNVNVIAALEDSAPSEIYFDEQDGRRVLLRWAASQQDIAGYKVFETDIDGNNPVLVATIKTKISEAMNLAYPDTGTGLGRISAPSISLPDDAFGSVTITITGSGTATYTHDGVTTAFSFTKGSKAFIKYNVPLFFADELEEYVTGDTWTISTGIHPHWLSEDLAPGSYRYGVSDFDIVGNESDITLSQVYEVVEQAEPVVGEVLTWDDENNILMIDYALPTGASSVRLYSNYLQTEGTIDDYVQLEPTATGTGSTLDVDGNPVQGTGFVLHFGGYGYGYGFDTGSSGYGYGYEENDFFDVFNIPDTPVEGTFRYYLMPVTAADVELQDFSLRTMSVPPDANDFGFVLGTPEALTGEPRGIDNWHIDWRYYFEQGDGLTHFTVHRIADGGSFTYDGTDQVANIPASSTGYGFVADYSFTMTGETIPAGPLQIAVVAHSAQGRTISEAITVTTIGSIELDAPSNVQGGTV